MRDRARLHYPYIPRALVPDAYPSIALVRHLRAPLLVLHGERDEIVPASHGEALFHAAPARKRMHVFPRVGHNDLVSAAAEQWIDAIARWADEVTGIPSGVDGAGPSGTSDAIATRAQRERRSPVQRPRE